MSSARTRHRAPARPARRARRWGHRGQPGRHSGRRAAPPVGVGGDAGEVDVSALGTEIPLDPGPVPRPLLGSRDRCGHPRLSTFRREVVDDPHEPDPDDPDTYVFHKAVQVSGLAHAFIAMFSRGRPRHQPISGRSWPMIRAIGSRRRFCLKAQFGARSSRRAAPTAGRRRNRADPRPRRTMAPRWKHRAVGGSPAGPRSSRWPSPLLLSAGLGSCSNRGRELNRRRRNDGPGRIGRGRSARARRSGLAHYRVYDEDGFLSSFALAPPLSATLQSSHRRHLLRAVRRHGRDRLRLEGHGRPARPEDRRRRAPGRRTATPK